MAKPSKNSRICPMLAALLVMIASGCADRSIDPDAPAAYFFSDPKVAALAAAAAAGDVAKIDRLVASGVDVNATGRGNITPLFRALAAKNKAGYEALLRHGANPNVIAQVLATHAAVMHLSAVNPDPFWLAAALQHGGDPNLRNQNGPEGQTPIYHAIWMTVGASIEPPRVENVKLLIEAGADVNATEGSKQESPLVAALGKQHYETALLLIQAGADTSTSCVEGMDLAQYLQRMTSALDVVPPDQVEWFWKVVELINERGANILRETPESKKQPESDGVDDGKTKQE